MTDQQSSQDFARKAAAVLSQRAAYPGTLPMEVERQILGDGQGDRLPDQMPWGVAEGIALATILLQCAQFAWQIWRETRNAETVARTLRIKVDKPAQLSVAQRDQVIEVVVAQLKNGA